MEIRNESKIEIIKLFMIVFTIIISLIILSKTFLERNKESEVIQVTGLGTKDFESDLIVWSGSFSQIDIDLKNAYERLHLDQNKIIDFLKKRNVSTNEYLFSAVVIDKEYETIYDKDKNQKRLFKGYRLMQDIKIESNEVEKIETISREITELINMGVEFYSSKPQYYYTKLTELKKELIEHATENAKTRAETIASKSGFKLGRLKNANMGVFQIIARNSNEDYSWAGTFNTTSKQKTATITMKLQFGIQ
mgnify:FL=1